MRAVVLGSVAAMTALVSQASGQVGVVSGTGSAQVSRDTASVTAQAERAAKEDLVRALARRELGAERLGELTPDMIARIAVQITDDVIVDRSAERIGREYRVTISARIDRAWFIGLLSDEGIRTSSLAAGASSVRILVMIDESIGPARDFSAPQQIVTEFDRDRGSSYNEENRLDFQDRQAQSSNVNAAASMSASASSSAQSTGFLGSDSGRASGRLASDARLSASNQSSSDTSLEASGSIQAQEHDVVRFRQSVTFQPTSSSSAGQAAMASITSGLIQYEVATSNAVNVLTSFSPEGPRLYTQLRNEGGLAAFLDHASRTAAAPFFMGGQLVIQDAGRNETSGQVVCTGTLTAQVFATSTSLDIAASSKSGEMAASTYELCASRLSEVLAREAVVEMGPQIQRYWRQQIRTRDLAVDAATTSTEYSLVVRGSAIDLDTQADLLDVLGSLEGVESQAFIEQSSNQVVFSVRYSGRTPLHLALFQRIRSNPRFAGVRTEVQGQTVILCISGC